jgi:malonyl CoA-acyl carrier protein transacylase
MMRTLAKKMFCTKKANTDKIIAVAFSGQGTQKVGMCKEFLKEDWSKEYLQKFDENLKYGIAKLMTEGPIETLSLQEYAQPAIYIYSFL